MLEYILCFIPQALVDKYQKFDGEAIEVLDSPPPSPRVAPATPVAKVRPYSDIMRSGEKVTPKRHLSFRRISNLVRKMTSPDPFDRSAWPAGVQGFYIGGRYYCKATRAPWSDEEVEEEPLDTSLLNGPYTSCEEEEAPEQAPVEAPEEFQYPDPEELEDKTLEIPEVVAPAPQVAQQVEAIQEPEISPLQD